MSDNARPRARSALTEEVAARLLESLRDHAVILLDASGIVRSFSSGAERVTGWSAEDMIGQTHALLYTPEDRAARKPEMDLTVAVHEGFRRDQWWRFRKDGSRYWAEVSIHSMRDDRGRLDGFGVIFSDASERRSVDLERERIEEQVLLSDRMASIGMLSAGVAHEIANPLAYVITNLVWSIEELEGPPEHADMVEVLDALKNSLEGAQRIERSATDLKLFARGEDKHAGAIDVRRVLESCVRMAWTEIRHRARLYRDYTAVARVEGSESRLAQVFLNVLVNAAHAIPEGKSERNEIVLRTRTEGDSVVVEIRDSGEGMRPDVLARAFEPFFTTKPLGLGTGLGLPICQRIVASMGGTIAIDSELGRGTRVRISLPCAASGAMRAVPAVVGSMGRRARLLVIDDEPMVAQSLQRTLAVEHDVVSVTRAADALKAITGGQRFDAVICDLMMPEMNGAALHAELARREPDTARRMIFLTGGAFTQAARDFLDTVDNPRLEKPFDGETLLGMVRDIVG